jgi:hypothetical protein
MGYLHQRELSDSELKLIEEAELAIARKETQWLKEQKNNSPKGWQEYTQRLMVRT